VLSLAASAPAWLAFAAARPTEAPSAPASPQPRLIYAGDMAFPPYEYLDAEGQPQGLNVEMLRLLSRHAGVSVMFRLGRWNEVIGAFERGQADLMSLAHSEWREQRYDFLVQTWTLHRSFLMRAGRERYPKSVEELKGEIVACEERGQLHEALQRLPLAQRPMIKLVANHLEACRLLQHGEATVAAGSGLTLRHFAKELGLRDVVDVSVASYPYYLVVRKGRAPQFDYLKHAFERVRETNEYHAVVERSLMPPDRPRGLLDERYFAGVALALVAIAGGSLAWNRTLRQKVQHRTRELDGTLRQKDRLTSALVETEARFRGMIDGLSLGVSSTRRTGRCCSRTRRLWRRSA